MLRILYVVLMLGYSVAFQILLLTDVLLFAFPVDRGNLFSCHHKISIFCKSSEDLSPPQYAFRRMLTEDRKVREAMEKIKEAGK